MNLWRDAVDRHPLGTVWCDVRRRKQPPAMADLPVPPVLVGAIGHRYDVAPLELQLALFLRREVVQRLD